ncbi:carbohydrate-binding protein [Haloferula sp.]|uniref:carbohydrate-binding protein n=1 Tax=Haloferula sp. TaxID=2497595 RepID=UPI003C7696D4
MRIPTQDRPFARLRSLPAVGLAMVVILFPATVLAQWNLVWSDEFDGNGELDQSKWNFEAFEPGANNNELQKYTWNRLENCRRENGVLVLEGRRDWWWDEGNQKTYEYTSARIQTAGKFTIKYGKIEMRAQMPWANGGWPAFWMMPQNGLYGGWPDSGEIDILEYVGWDNDIAHVNAHTRDRNFLIGTNYGWSGWVGGMENSYHTYGIEWWHDRIDFYIDGIWRYGFRNEGNGPGDWPFNSEFFIILNHAIGGWGGIQGIDNEAYGTAGDNYGVGYFVDWVRAYKWDWPDHDIPAHVEAEHYEGYGGDIREEKCNDVGEGWSVGFIDTGDFMQYNFNIPASGWYQVDYRVSSDSAGGILTLGKEGVDLKRTRIPDTGGWQNWQTVSDRVWLDAGAQTLDVYATNGGWNLNHFKINSAPPATQVEAEYYAAMSGVLEQPSEDTGGGISVGWIDTNDWMSYPVVIPVAGTYELTYRVASEVGGGIITLGRDGVDLKQTPAPNTGGWTNWTTITDTVDLEQGPQTLTLFATSGGWNMNWWRYELLDPDYAVWEERNEITGSGRSNDHDRDGWTNEAEYYFGLNPNSGSEDPTRIPKAGFHTTGGNYPTFTYTRRTLAPDVTYTVEISDDLSKWTPIIQADGGSAPYTYTLFNESDDHGDGTQTVTIRYNVDVSAATTSNLFFRLVATE